MAIELMLDLTSWLNTGRLYAASQQVQSRLQQVSEHASGDRTNNGSAPAWMQPWKEKREPFRLPFRVLLQSAGMSAGVRD
ncbi:hypothetical protein ACQ86G_20285 [Roseateles chitinivorans]|uniref:hypothetical protein n=1 Tax=Roseateles chitinivorans TaxID=2917965 RepID=UPI003D67C77D